MCTELGSTGGADFDVLWPQSQLATTRSFLSHRNVTKAEEDMILDPGLQIAVESRKEYIDGVCFLWLV